MSTNIENCIFRGKVNGETKQLFFNTGVDNIVVAENGSDITLSQKLTEIISSISELSTNIKGNAERLDSLNELIDSKVATEEGKELVSTALVESLNTLDFDVLTSLIAEKLESLEQDDEDDDVIE